MASDSSVWFDKNWIRQIIEFENPLYSWTVVEKQGERENLLSRGIWTEKILLWSVLYLHLRRYQQFKSGYYENSNAVRSLLLISVCLSNWYYRIPYFGAGSSSPKTRASQARPDTRGQTSREIKALKDLTEAKCFCTPKLEPGSMKIKTAMTGSLAGFWTTLWWRNSRREHSHRSWLTA